MADVVLSGAATVPQLHRNLQAMVVQLEDRVLDHLTGLAISSESYWEDRAAPPWA